MRVVVLLASRARFRSRASRPSFGAPRAAPPETDGLAASPAARARPGAARGVAGSEPGSEPGHPRGASMQKAS